MQYNRYANLLEHAYCNTIQYICIKWGQILEKPPVIHKNKYLELHDSIIK